MRDQCLRTVFIYQEDYHKLLKTAHPQRLAFQKQCPRSINIEYSQRFAYKTHTQTDKLSTITLGLHARVKCTHFTTIPSSKVVTSN